MQVCRGQRLLEATKRRDDTGILSALFSSGDDDSPYVESALKRTDGDMAISYADYQGRYGETALMIATLQNNVPVVELLLQDARADPNLGDRQGTTALMLAALANRTRIIPLILAAGGDPCLEDDQGECACVHAIKRGHMEAYKQIARLLYIPLHDTCNKDPDECISRKMLQACLKYNQTDMFQELFESGYCMGNLEKECMALHSIEICEILARSCVVRWDTLSLSPKERSAWADGVFVSVLDSYTSYRLDADTIQAHLEVLIDHGLSKYLESPNKHLMLTLRWGCDVLGEVMRYTTDINYQSKAYGGSTALIGSICFSYRTRKGSLIDMIYTLMDAGADVTIANNQGLTAFHYAIYRREPEALECLITACSERIREAFSHSYPQSHDLGCIKDASRRIASSFLHGLELNIQLHTCLDNGMQEPCCAYNFIQYMNLMLRILGSADASYVLPCLTVTKDDEDSIFAELNTWHSSESDASPEYSDDDDDYSSDEDEQEEASSGNIHSVMSLSPQAIDSPPWWSIYDQS